MKAFLSDMDGVVYRGSRLIPGAADFVRRLQEGGFRFLFLTNNSEQTPLDLLRRLEGMGIGGLAEENFITSAMATAEFLHAQRPGGTAFVIGGSGLANELYKVGFSLTEKNPDYVVVGKTRQYNYEMIEKAVRLVAGGARFIATNPDMVDPTEHGLEPACGSLLAPIEQATGRKAYVIGKPNALMMLIARRMLGSRTQDTVMIGDRMDTDIVAGMEAGMTTALVLSGVTTREMLEAFPWRPDHVFSDLGEIDPARL
jgi:NagD protein